MADLEQGATIEIRQPGFVRGVLVMDVTPAAQTARDEAQAAAAAAETSKDAALAAETGAEASATAAATSAAAAGSSESAAQAAATTATTKAGEAETSATEAATSATAAQTARTGAEAAAALATDISNIDTSDEAIDAALQLPDGLAAARLSATIEAGVVAGLASTPTKSQIVQALPLGTSIATTSEFPIAAALFTSRLDQFALLSTSAVAASDTNYWAVELVRWRAGDARTIAYKTTRTTEGQAITALSPWTFDTREWADYAVAAAGDAYIVKFTRYGTAAALTLPTITYRVEPTDEASPATPTVLGADSFDRADSAVSLGAPDVGAWEILDASVWGISGNQAYVPTSTGAGHDIVVMDAGTTQVSVQVKVASGFEASHSCGLTVRTVDTANRYQIGNGNIYRVAGGVATSLLSWGATSFGNGDTMRAVCEGDTISVYMQRGSVGPFVFVGSVTDSTVQGTKHGIRNGADGDSSNRFEGFRMETL